MRAVFREGKGTFSYKNGDLYTGRFDNDEFNGKGKISFGSLDVYEGDFIDGRLEGHGVMEYKVSIIQVVELCDPNEYFAGRNNSRRNVAGLETSWQRNSHIQKRFVSSIRMNLLPRLQHVINDMVATRESYNLMQNQGANTIFGWF